MTQGTEKDDEGDLSDNSTFYSSEDADEKEDENILQRLEDDIKERKWSATKKNSEEEARKIKEDFKLKHRETVLKQDQSGRNIFHILADTGDKKLRKLKTIVQTAVELAPLMLNEPNKEGKTGIHLAIERQNYSMLRYVFKHYEKLNKDRTSSRKLDPLLRISNQTGNNVVHLAMQYLTPVNVSNQNNANATETIIKIIEGAENSTLCQQNNVGYTPLHLAVEGEKCSEQQLQIIIKLVEACPDALDVWQYNKKRIKSVYQVHQDTWESFKAEKLQRGGASQIDTGATAVIAPSETKERSDKNRSTSTRVNNISTPVEGDVKRGIIRSGTNSNFNDTNLHHYDNSRQPKDEKNYAIEPPPPSSSSTIDAKSVPQIQTKDIRQTITDENGRHISNFLKHKYLRCRSRQQAQSFLYGAMPEKQIDFNLFGKEGEILESDFKAGYKCANLEDTLQVVRIPHLIIKPTNTSQSSGERENSYENDSKPLELQVANSLSTGRKNLGIIFRWLRDQARVEKIIKLVVDDFGQPSHTDEEIEEAAKLFDIEIWDWRKVDLCCNTIAAIAPNVRHINLYWSGNNAVLLGWSHPDGGLAQLPNLERVHIYSQLGIEGKKRNERNLKDFEKRLKLCTKGREQLHVKWDHPISQTQLSQPLGIKNIEAFQNHRWLKCMDSFARFIRTIRLDDSSMKLKPIKIAIIDDGIDTTTQQLHRHIDGGQCFYSDEESPSFFVSAKGHGTMMARLITRIFPQARILSLKLDEHTQSDGTSQFSVSSAVKAIHWATAQGVSIINMSWSIEKTDSNEKDLEDLLEAVTAAEQRKILMFCSTNDQGKTKDMSYPGKFSRSTMLKIGAATATGTEYHYVALSDINYLFPGRVVEREQDENAMDNGSMEVKDRSTEGSSLATAFASGLAGLIFYILQLSSIGGSDDVSGTRTHWQIMQNDPSKMKAVFHKLATKEKQFVEVWKVFEKAEATRRNGNRENSLKTISDICSELMSGLDF